MKLAQTGQKFQGLLEGFLEAWVEGNAAQPPCPPAASSQPIRQRREHELLERILTLDPKMAGMVRTQLELLAELAEARAAAAKQTKAG